MTLSTTTVRRTSPTAKPVLFVTNYAPAYRVGAFERLHERENVEFALFGGRLKHGGDLAAADLPFPHRYVPEHTLKGAPHGGADPHGRRQASELYTLATSGRDRAIVCPTSGRLAVLATWAGARRARLPLILWASLWAHPRSAAHAFSYVALRRLYGSADAVVTYGPHVSSYVCARGAHNVYSAAQAVDNDFWRSPDVNLPTDPRWPAHAAVKFLFAGRPAREKGLGVLVEAWSMSGLQAPTAALVLVGAGSTPPWVPPGGAVVGLDSISPSDTAVGLDSVQPGDTAVGFDSVQPGDTAVDLDSVQPSGAAVGPDSVSPGDTVVGLDPVSPTVLRDFYAAADVLVLPSIPTRTFREPWGLVINEAMNRELPVIASDAVGAAAGGLVRDGRNGVIVPAADRVALATALKRLAADSSLRARLGKAGREDVSAYTYDAWAGGFSSALAALGLSGGR
jgi:glycosyltransferase involved in cell wall biosynthesis